jgi:hypothetical protein
MGGSGRGPGRRSFVNARCLEQKGGVMKRLMLLLTAAMFMVWATALPVFAQDVPGEETVTDPAIPVEGETADGGTVEGTLQDATITVDETAETVTVDGTLVGEVEESGEVVEVVEPVTETIPLEEAEGTTCTLGYITLDGNLTVALLGLHISITELNVLLEGDSSEGLLGNLLCGLAG